MSHLFIQGTRPVHNKPIDCKGVKPLHEPLVCKAKFNTCMHEHTTLKHRLYVSIVLWIIHGCQLPRLPIGYMIWGSGDHTWWPTNPSLVTGISLFWNSGFIRNQGNSGFRNLSVQDEFSMCSYIENYEELQTQTQREYFTWCNYPHHMTGKGKKGTEVSEVLLHVTVLRHGWDWELSATTNLGTLDTPPIKCFKCVFVSFLSTH
jgi:hypothetical protein